MDGWYRIKQVVGALVVFGSFFALQRLGGRNLHGGNARTMVMLATSMGLSAVWLLDRLRDAIEPWLGRYCHHRNDGNAGEASDSSVGM